MLNTSHSNGTTSAPSNEVGRLLAVRIDALVPPGRRVDLIEVDTEGGGAQRVAAEPDGAAGLSSGGCEPEA